MKVYVPKAIKRLEFGNEFADYSMVGTNADASIFWPHASIASTSHLITTNVEMHMALDNEAAARAMADAAVEVLHAYEGEFVEMLQQIQMKPESKGL